MIPTQTVIQEAESALTDRYQTTVPAVIRKSLGLHKRDKLRYSLLPDGRVVIEKAATEERDPIIGTFLNFLAKDMENNPHHIQSMDEGALKHMKQLVAGMYVDLDKPLSPEDD